MIRRPPISTRTDTLFPTRRSSDLLIVVQWAYYARTVRGTALVERNKEYIEAAVCLGLSHRRIVFRHLLPNRSEEHTSELQSLMRISYAVFCLKKKKKHNILAQINIPRTTTE